jgi:hypothetical protein
MLCSFVLQLVLSAVAAVDTAVAGRHIDLDLVPGERHILVGLEHCTHDQPQEHRSRAVDLDIRPLVVVVDIPGLVAAAEHYLLDMLGIAAVLDILDHLVEVDFQLGMEVVDHPEEVGSLLRPLVMLVALMLNP